MLQSAWTASDDKFFHFFFMFTNVFTYPLKVTFILYRILGWYERVYWRTPSFGWCLLSVRNQHFLVFAYLFLLLIFPAFWLWVTLLWHTLMQSPSLPSSLFRDPAAHAGFTLPPQLGWPQAQGAFPTLALLQQEPFSAFVLTICWDVFKLLGSGYNTID